MKIISNVALFIISVIDTAVPNVGIYPAVFNSLRHDDHVGSCQTKSKFKKYADSLAGCGSE